MAENTNDVIESGIAVLADGDSTVVHGVAIGENDITEGMSGKRTLWPGSALEDAAEELAGKPLVRDHPGAEKADGGVSVDAQPPIDSVVGEVTDAKYRDGVGLLFEAEVDDESLAEQIERGRADVSPIVARELGEFDDDHDAHTVDEIVGFRDLGVVSRGAAPSNDIQPGAATAMMAEALSSAFAPQEQTESSSDGAAESAAGVNESSTMELTDGEERLVREARNADDPVVVESETEALADEFATYDDPEIVEKDAYEALGERVSGVRDVLAEALSEQTGLSEDAAKSLEFDALMGEFEDDDGNLDAEALVQSPETGQPDVDEQDTGLTDDDRERIEQIDAKLDALGESLPRDRVEALQSEAAELAGTDNYDAALEVL